MHDFCCDTLKKMNFLDAVKNGATLSEAYEKQRSQLCLPQGMDAILHGTFSSFGRGGRREEARRLATEVARAEALLKEERSALARRSRLCRTLATASAMGVVILLL
jgi:hypothetical protein